MKHHLTFRWRFVLRILFPVILAIGLFVIAFYAIILPAYEKGIMDRKAEMIRELTNSGWSIACQFHEEQQSGKFSVEEAQREAAARIGAIRYGQEGKDYFWITDLEPTMVMHPYRPDLNGQSLSGFLDPTGKALFVEMVDSVLQDHTEDGYVAYQWQWKDNAGQIVPKLSYVKLFKPWGWVIGTGVYLEDVKEEIAAMEKGLLTVVVVITVVLALLMGVVAFQSFRIERRRQQAEEEIRKSEEKYRTLVNATEEGTLMVRNTSIVYANKLLQNLSGFTEEALMINGLTAIFADADLRLIRERLPEVGHPGENSVILDTRLVRQSGETIPVELSITLLPLGQDFVQVIKVKPITKKEVRSRIDDHLQVELQASVVFLSQPMRSFPQTYLSCELNTPVRTAAQKMTDKGYDAILILSEKGDSIGIVTDEDIRKRMVAVSDSADQPVFRIMSSPLLSIPEKAMVYEAISLMQEKQVSHLGIRNNDGVVVSMVSNRELLQVHQYSISLIRQQISKATTIEALTSIGNRIPELTSSMLDAGADPANLLRFSTILFDAMIDRIIRLALIELGEPPVPFVFLVLGSAGREEQTLATDQDNAILFEEVEEDRYEAVQTWFLRLGSMVSTGLAAVGYRYCPGKIMASNPTWCQSLSHWKSAFSSWITSAEPQDLLDINIFFDFRAVFGSRDLSAALYAHIQDVIQSHPAFFIFLAENIQKLKPPLSLFGNIVVGKTKTEPDAFDIKKVMVPLVDIARLYALKEGIRETSTLGRLEKLVLLGILNEEQYEDRVEAYKILMMIRLRHQAKQFSLGIPINNFINPDAIPHVEEAMLKKIFLQITEFIGRVVMEFRGGLGT